MTDKKNKSKNDTKQQGTTVTFLDPGKGYVTRSCPDCDGTGRVYEGGYGMRNCPTCRD